MSPDADTIESEETFRAPTAGAMPSSPDQLPEVPTTAYVQIDEFARGGLGRIIRARDTRTGRMVAIKEMLASDDDAAARFVREALVTANLQHPAIVPVYEVGRWPNGRPFYAMQLVQGRPLNVAIDACTTVDGRLALLPHAIAVADALAYAHREGVIHRDLKPQNVLVGTHGETVVIDWGLARRVSDVHESLPRASARVAGETVLGDVMGTPAYMAPEQARGERVDEHVDVYAIGALLYHVLAGAPPYKGTTSEQIVERVKTGPPQPLREVAPATPNDLVAIVERAMARDAAARYPSAGELAIDLRRFADGQLVLARHYTRLKRLGRFARKQRTPLAIAAFAFATIAILGTISLRDVLASREQARLERAEADRARDEATRRLRASYLEQARQELGNVRGDRALPLLSAAANLGDFDAATRFLVARALEQLPPVVRRDGTFTGGLLLDESQDVLLSSQAGLERWSPSKGTIVWQRTGAVSGIALAGDEVAATRASGVALIATSDGSARGELPVPSDVAGFGPVSADPDHRWIVAVADGHVVVWERASRRLAASIPAPGAELFTFISNDGERVLVLANVRSFDTARIVDLRGNTVATLCSSCGSIGLRRDMAIVQVPFDISHPTVRIVDWQGRVKSTLQPIMNSKIGVMELSLGEETIALGGDDGSIETYDVRTGALRWQARIPVSADALKYDASGRLWVLGHLSGLFAFDAATGVELAHYPSVGDNQLEIAFDGDALLSIGDRSVTAWGVPALTRAAIAPTGSRVKYLTFAPDGTLITGSQDGTIATFDQHGRERSRFASPHASPIRSLQVLADGTIITSTSDEDVVLWDGATHRELRRIHAGFRVEASGDASTIAIGNDRGEVSLWRRDTGEKIRMLARLAKAIVSVHWSPDGSKVVAIDDDGRLAVWDAASGREQRSLPEVGVGMGLDLAISPDSRWLVRTVTGPIPVALHALGPDDADHGLADLPTAEVSMATFSRDGKLVALAGPGYVGVWDAVTGARRMLAHTGTSSTAVAFAADSSLLYSIGVDRALRVWDVANELPILRVLVPAEAYMLAIAPDGTRAAIGTLGAGMLLDISSFTGDRAELVRAAETRTTWQLDASGRLVERSQP